MAYQLASEDMIAMEYTFFDNRKVVLIDVFAKVNQLNPLRPGDRYLTDQIKDDKSKYHIILTVKNVTDNYDVHAKETGGSVATHTCYKLLED
jgi:hypothetical protein